MKTESSGDINALYGCLSMPVESGTMAKFN